MIDFPYTIARHPPPSATFEGSGRQYDVMIRAKAKRHPDNPFEIANEVLALRLGAYLNLPIPLGCVLEFDGESYFASLDVAVAEEKLPPATNADIQQILKHERIACGIIVFDSWIANGDRYRHNISYNDETDSICIFDHGRALFTSDLKSMEKNRSQLGFDEHCLRDIGSLSFFLEWHELIMEMPSRYLRESIRIAARNGLPAEHQDFMYSYLVERRSCLPRIFDANRTFFRKLERTLFDPFLEEPDYQI